MGNGTTKDVFTIIDVDGQERHKWSKAQLQALYNDLANFCNDCTIEERKRFRESIVDIMAFILQRMQVNKH